jgi:pyruvate ferredoxin oxidoreductase alpha subunit
MGKDKRQILTIARGVESVLRFALSNVLKWKRRENSMNKPIPLTGAHAVSEAMRQINPAVVAVYPITPQTPIVEKFASYVANGLVDTELVRVESEHSAMSATVGASSCGIRAMTATSSAGLALMWEIIGVASGLRCPIVMPVANRALSSPLNIHCDHSDSMGARDLSWLQVYSEDGQEAYENTLLALRIAEHKDIMLPMMVCQDGFITSHGVQNVRIFDDEPVREYLGEYKAPHSLFDFENSPTIGAIELQDYYFETKRQQEDSMEKSFAVFKEMGKDLSKITGSEYDFVEEYHTDDADAIIVTMSSAAGTTKTVVDKMRKEGKKVGLLKIKLFRPFPQKEVTKALAGAKAVAVLDRSMAFGAGAPIYSDVKSALYDLSEKPKLQSYVFGMGGRDLFDDHIEAVFESLLRGETSAKQKYINLRE